jgi:EAL and modified HD-GYP domain-containing signal transduction protein
MTTSLQSTILVGRQQIYDCDLNVAAYELLFRSSADNCATFLDGDVATSQLLMNAFVEIGLENLAFGRPSFVNFTRNFIVGKYDIPFEPKQLVIEVLETVEPDSEVIAALGELRKSGFKIALDDYVDSDNREQLLALADIVKIDVRGYSQSRLRAQAQRLKMLPLKLLAEKVETAEEFSLCKALGFNFFQGYFLSRPQIVKGKAIAANQFAMLRLLGKLRDPAVTFDEVVELVKQDITLSLKLLRYVNSLAHGVRQQIDSVRQAAVRLGLQKICQLVTLLAVNGITDKPRPLLETALVRARMCEIIGALKWPERREICFTVGLFSSLDVLLDQPLSEILIELPVSPEIREALLSQNGPLGQLLGSVIAFERCDWEAARRIGEDDSIIQKAYLNALTWGHAETKLALSEGV